MNEIVVPDLVLPRRRIGSRTFDFSRQVAISAIVEPPPTPLEELGHADGVDAAVAAAVAALREGADWVDIRTPTSAARHGGPTPDEELNYVVPIIKELRAASDVVISIATVHPDVARRAIAVGADVVIDALESGEPDLAALAADTGVTLVVTHAAARAPQPPHGDVVQEVASHLASRIELALNLGVLPRQLVVDPGHSLNKSSRDALELTRRLDEITALRHPVIVDVSNREFIGETLDVPHDERSEGTVAALTLCILQGARIVRVHEVARTVEAVRMTEAILGLPRS